MRIRKPGKIAEHLWFLGREESCVYLIEGNNESIIISGGVSYILPDILRQFEEFGIDQNRISKLLILHSHFDHVGIIPFLKRKNGSLKIYASERAWEILGMPKAVKTINAFSLEVAERLKKKKVLDDYDLEWRDIPKGFTVHEGDIIDLGGIKGRIIETPGHSSCSITFYSPELKALFPSDGGGIPLGETILASGNSNYTKYQKSLEKLKGLKCDYVCADHYGYVTGDEAGSFILQSIENARDFRAYFESLYFRKRDINAAVKEFAEGFYRENQDYFLPPAIMESVHRQMLRHIVENVK